ncbi:MAG: ZPR1 zinc finger domain-containing protein [Promethearchaeia archaeon]
MSKKAEKTKEEYSFNCPSCKKGTISIEKTVYQLPDKDQMLIIKFECDTCKFNKSDVIPITTRTEPGVSILKVTTKKDLESKVYRSPTGEMEIPELELVVKPGHGADFYFTNIEGILDRFERAVAIYKSDLQEDEPDAEDYKDVSKVLDDIKKAKNGEFEFTLKIEDHGGGSYILPTDESKFSFKEIDVKDEEE